jgi:hypothetical protein
MAIARPMPDAAPVIKAFLPRMLFIAACRTRGRRSPADNELAFRCKGIRFCDPPLEPSWRGRAEQRRVLRRKRMHPRIDDWFFTGLFRPIGCVRRPAYHQARIAALQSAGRLPRPADLAARVGHEAPIGNSRERLAMRSRWTTTISAASSRER